MLSDLQENYRRDADERAAENMRQMNNNMGLIREITRQRESNRRLRSQVDRMEMQLKERARDNKGPDPAVVARQHARAQELQRLVDHYASTLEAAGSRLAACCAWRGTAARFGAPRCRDRAPGPLPEAARDG